MKIHSDIIERSDLIEALPKPEMYLEARQVGSRKRTKAFDLSLEWLAPKRKGDGRRRKNSGKYGAAHAYAATYDEHGEWMANLYRIDPEAIIATYDNALDFHRKTDGKYAADLAEILS